MDDANPLDPMQLPGRRHVIACATVMEEMLPLLPPDVSYEVLDFGLHLRPGGLKSALQARIDACHAETILLGYGLCSMAVVGLISRVSTLVAPKVDDCIAIYLGSRGAYQQQAELELGTYYLTKGWIEVGDSPFEEHQRLVERYGAETADYITGEMLKHYKRVCFINTGGGDLERYHAYARRMADRFNLRYEEVDGSPALIQRLIQGPWDKDFVVAPPDKPMTFAMFANTPPAAA
jgi:hypothetical protein